MKLICGLILRGLSRAYKLKQRGHHVIVSGFKIITFVVNADLRDFSYRELYLVGQRKLEAVYLFRLRVDSRRLSDDLVFENLYDEISSYSREINILLN